MMRNNFIFHHTNDVTANRLTAIFLFYRNSFKFTIIIKKTEPACCYRLVLFVTDKMNSGFLNFIDFYFFVYFLFVNKDGLAYIIVSLSFFVCFNFFNMHNNSYLKTF